MANKLINTSKEIDAGKFLLADSDSEVDGVNILAKVSGPAFFPGEVGGNSRVYSEECWIKTLEDEEFQSRLDKRIIFGSIGHDVEVDDDAIRNGLISHIVTKMWIDPETDIGMAEYLVLNTAPGKILNTLLRAKCKLSVSTLASGTTTDLDGVEYADPDTFAFERIDFVINPSYSKAIPNLIESLQTMKNTHSKNPSEELEMPEQNKEPVKLAESLAAANADLKHYVALGTPASLAESLAELRNFREIGESPIVLSKTLAEANGFIDGHSERLAQLEAENQSYRQELKLLREENDELKQSSAVTETDQAASVPLIEQIENAETPEEVAASLAEADEDKDALAQWGELGTLDDVKTRLAEAEQNATELAAYKEVVDGATPEEVKTLLENVQTMVDQDVDRKYSELAEDLSVDPEAIAKLREKGLDIDECRDLIASIKPQAPLAESDPEDDEQAAIEQALAESDDEDDEEDKESEVEGQIEEPKSLGESLNSQVLRRLAESKMTVQGKQVSTRKKEAEAPRTVRLAESLVASQFRTRK